MKRKMVLFGIVSAVAVFTAAMAFTVSAAGKPGCNRCKKDGCPSGYCYVDCVGCCFEDSGGNLVCFR